MSVKSGDSIDYWTCTRCRKRKYHSKSDAKKVAKRLNRKLSAYKCHDGDGWHLGHLSPPIKAGRLPRGHAQHDQTRQDDQ